jgi:hypothetical protein
MGLQAKITSVPLKIADTVPLQYVKVKATGMRAGGCYVALVQVE